MDGYFDRKIISIHDDDELEDAELILKRTFHTPVRKLPLATFRQHEKQSSEEDDDDEDDDKETTDQLTNQSVGGVQRARQLAEQNSDDVLPRVYGGLFTVAEYFTRSFDAIKGKFFEKVIAAEDPSYCLDVDRKLGDLPQYLLEPGLCWKSLSYTRESLTEDEETRLENLSSLSLNLHEDNVQATADATRFEGDTLVFGEHRTSVVSGGKTARDSLMRKPKALVEEMKKSDEVISIGQDVAEEYEIEARSYSLSSFLKSIGVSNIHFHIGILFDEERHPASWGSDPHDGTNGQLLREFTRTFLRDGTGYVQNVNLDSDNLLVEFDVSVEPESEETIHVHLSFLYGDNYLNTLYTGSLDAVGRNGSHDTFENPTSLREIISENDADDLWLGFSVAERENKVFETNAEGSNNAMEIADMILDDEELSRRLIRFRKLCRSGSREEIDDELLSFATDLAEQYDEERDNRWAEWVYENEDDPLHYLRDVALQVLVYDIISRPVFLRRFPEATAPEPVEDDDEQTEPTLSDARYTFEQYLFDIKTDTTKKENIMRVVRNQTRYQHSGTNIPHSEDDPIDWPSAPTKGEIGYILDVQGHSEILESMSRGTTKNKGGLLKENGDKYAVPASVANQIGEFMLELTPEEQTILEAKRPSFLSSFPEATPPESNYDGESDTNPTLGDIRYTFENYLFDIKRNTDNRESIMQVVRNQTRYQHSGTNVPESEDDPIDWANSPTKSDVGRMLDIRTPTRTLNSMSNGTSKHKGGLLEKNGNKYAVPPSVAYRMGGCMLNLPENI